MKSKTKDEKTPAGTTDVESRPRFAAVMNPTSGEIVVGPAVSPAEAAKQIAERLATPPQPHPIAGAAEEADDDEEEGECAPDDDGDESEEDDAA